MMSVPRSLLASRRIATLASVALGAIASFGPSPGAFAQSTSNPSANPSALAQAAQSGAARQPRAEPCIPRPGRLGVSRIVEIDTNNGPRFGHQQYKDNDFLREGEVVLTFDDGPLRRNSRMVLDALAAHCTQATFFMVGQMAVVDPDMVREIARAGHTVGIHTWSHRNLRAAGAAKATQEIELGISAVQRALGEQAVAPFFRFPYLADSPAMLSHVAERRFAAFSIDIDSRDFRTKDPRTMQKNVLDALRTNGKGILLFHDIQISTATGIRGLLDELANRGFKIVHTVPKVRATTLATYDAMAEAEFSRRSKVAAATPMATRSVVWPMTAGAVPVEPYRAQGDVTGAAGRAPTQATGQATVRPGAVRTPASGGPVAPIAAPVAPAVSQPAVAQPTAPTDAPPRPALRGTTDDDDWRRRLFPN